MPGWEAILFAVLAVAISWPCAAQTTASTETAGPLSALSSRIRPGDRISVGTSSGDDIQGTFSGASATALTMVADGQTREIPASTIVRVMSEHGRNRLVTMLLIGAPLGAFLGSGACYHVEPTLPPGSPKPSSTPCGAAVAAGAAIGGGVGALIGSRMTRPALVYSRLPGQPVARAATPEPFPQQAGPARHDTQTPASSLSALSSSLLPFEAIEVETAGGRTIRGTFSGASETALTIDVDGQPRQIPAADVRRVWRRGGSKLRTGMLAGFVAGAVAISIPFASAYGAEALPVSIAVGGGVGLLFGGLIGSFAHERHLVFQPGASVQLVPMVGPRVAGIATTIQF